MNHKEIFFILYVLITLGISIWAFDYNYKQGIWKIVGFQLLISRITAEQAKWHLALILITVNYPIIDYIRHRIPQLNIFDGSRRFHAFLGKGLGLIGVTHSISHLFTMKFIDRIDPTFTAGYYHALFVAPWGWTGWCMNIILLIIFITSTRFYRKNWYNSFFNIHHLYGLFIIFILIHGSTSLVASPTAAWWIGLPLLFFLIYKLYAICMRQTPLHITGKIIIEGEHDSAILIHLNTTYIFKRTKGVPGQVVWLNCPKISYIEWHPFSILSISNNQISLLIHDRGDWSHDLYNLIKTGELNSYPTLYIDGPYCSTADEYYRFNNLIFISAGIGTIPLASILYYMRRICSKYKVENLRTYWIFKYRHQIDWVSQKIQDMHEIMYGIFTCNIFITRDEQHNYAHRNLSNSNSIINYCRPDIDQIFIKIIQSRDIHKLSKPIIYGVFVCGPKNLMKDVSNACRIYSNNVKNIKFIIKRIK